MANKPPTPGSPLASLAKALGGTGGLGSTPDRARTKRKMTSPEVNDSGREEALGYGGGR